MFILGDVLAIVAVLVGTCLTLWATVLSMSLVFGRRTMQAREAISDSPWRCLGVGALAMGTLGLLGLALAAQPMPLAKLLGTAMLLALLATAALGLGGLALHAAHRMEELHPGTTVYSGLTRSSLLLVMACMLPFLGWFLFGPIVLLAGLGAGIKALRARGDEALAVRSSN